MNKAGKIRIGTCGFGRTKDDYAELLKCVEVQHTFYQPPMVKTLEKWREMMPADFEFTLKAWQLITHDQKSPTYKRLKKKITDEERADAGYFRPTAIVQEAWETTLACAKALKAKTVLFQCPASFMPYEENIENMTKFFSTVDRGKLNFAWEPRGKWDDALVKKLCKDLKLWHTVDPFKAKTVTPQNAYFRLHGIGGWRYKYDDAELAELVALLPKEKPAYVFFNNREMLEDAVRFRDLLGG
jgi:uncharacterized protein YecE (DUF72 family)